MKTRLSLIFLGFACFLNTVRTETECNLKGKQAREVPFPNIIKEVAGTYILGVEYSTPDATQTDYYTEYYDDTTNEGRIDSHIDGESKKYIYSSNTWESWTLHHRNCEFMLINETAYFFKDDQTDWRHYERINGTVSEQPTTIGPSAMFKVASDVWNEPIEERKKKMVYMGESDKDIRGEKAVYWRRCVPGGTFVDYFFADQSEDNPSDTELFGKVYTPLRISYYGVGKAEEPGLARQFYDIISFQPFIPKGVEPFELPKGLNCKRGGLVVSPKLPDFDSSSLYMSAEVVYSRYSTKDDAFELLTSYYSTLRLAIDRTSHHLAYYYSDWNATKPDKYDPFVRIPQKVVYDYKRGYDYQIDFGTTTCSINRQEIYRPQYKLPEERGNLKLSDPYVLFPNNEMSYLSTGTDRGLTVDIFEGEIGNYVMDKDNIINRMIYSHSYLKYATTENTVEIKNAPTQVELHLFRDNEKDIEEVLTFNIFRFTTKLSKWHYRLFDISPCFKNDDDYAYLTIGFEVPSVILPQIQKLLPDIERETVNQIKRKSELNELRMPVTMTDMKDNYVYVTLLILDKPPVQLDFNPGEGGQTVVVAKPEEDTQLLSSFEECASTCLEEKGDCWGFSLCGGGHNSVGGRCYFGSTTNVKVDNKDNCTLYRIYSNDSFIPSKEHQIQNLVGAIQSEEFNVEVVLENGDRKEIRATVAQVTDPAEDDSLFNKMGNKLNPKMKVHKAATRLLEGTEVKNIGKLRYDQCQSECLDYRSCESLSYCLIDGQCMVTSKFGDELEKGELKADELCLVLTRIYTSLFDESPGLFIKGKGGVAKEVKDVNECARACLKDDSCLSFDHCGGFDKQSCQLYTTHYLNPKDRKEVEGKSPSCAHYSKKFSLEFKKKEQIRMKAYTIPPQYSLTLEECAKNCIEYGSSGICSGFDYCQDDSKTAVSCHLFDADPSPGKTEFSSTCTNYFRGINSTDAQEDIVEYQTVPRPFTNSYAGGIGFLCFLIGGVLGVVAVFGIAYLRVNRRQ